MARHGLVAVLGCLYAACSIWLVQSEGRAYRDRLSRSRPRSSATPNVNPAGARPGSTETAPGVRPGGDSPAPWERTEPGESSGLESRARESTPPTSEMERPTPNSPAPAKDAGRVEEADHSRKIDPYWKQPFLNKVWDLDKFSTRDEVALGGNLNRVILEFNPCDARSGLRRIVEIARPLVESRSRKNLDYTFTILDSDLPNAFSHPGGFIYISRGLLEMVSNDENHVLEFVISHEMGHLELGHALACLRNPAVRELQDGTLMKLYILILPLAYPDELEFAADAWAWSRMRRLGRSDFEILAFLRKLEAYAKAEGFEDGRGKMEDLANERRVKGALTAMASPIENHLRAHTAAWKRLDQLKKLRDRVGEVAR